MEPKQRLLIVGGVAGGATAAARARRINEHAEIILFERGKHVSFANCGLPYYIGNVIQKRDELFLSSPEQFDSWYRVQTRILSEVTAIEPDKKQVQVLDHRTGQSYTEAYDKLILSPGASPIKPPLEGIDLEEIFQLRDIPDTDRIKGFIETRNPKSAVVVGGGFIGLEMAENLVRQGIRTCIVELLDQVMPPLDQDMAVIIQDHLVAKGVELRLADAVKSFHKKDGQICVTTASGDELVCDMVVMAVGVRPEIDLAKQAGLTIGQLGGIVVDETMRTSNPDIFAVGDAVEVKDLITEASVLTPLAGPANKQARIAADNAMGRHSVFRGTLGTSVVKVFDMTAASTGASEKTLKRHAIPYLASYTHSGHHAMYYPGATLMSVKLLFSPETGKILGAQIIGQEGVDKRIDVIATAIRGRMTVYDLEELELAYAPPYGSAKDPINIAGFVAANMLKGDLAAINWYEVQDLGRDSQVLLDLRTAIELRTVGQIKGAVHIPLHELRQRLSELDKSKTYITFCAVGYRGYLAHRILTQNGFQSCNLSGGFQTYHLAKQIDESS